MKRVMIFVVVMLAICVSNVWSQVGGTQQGDDKTAEEAAKKALAEFQKAYKEAKDKDDKKIKAFDIIRGITHKLIIDELTKLLRNEKSKKVKLEVINLLGMYKLVDCVKPLEEALKKEEKDVELRDMIISALGIIAHCHCIKPLKTWVEKNVSSIESDEMAATTAKAVGAFANIKNKDSIDILIKNYEKAENIIVPDTDSQKKASRDYLLNSFKNTLQILTGMDFASLPENAKEWKKWWSKEKPKFKFPGEQ